MVTVIPVAMKQNSDSVCASGGIETVTVSEMKMLVLFSASNFMVIAVSLVRQVLRTV